MRCAIIGSGNIGTDLMVKILRHGRNLQLAAMVGIDPASDGLARARRMGVATTDQGLDGLLAMPGFADIDIVFDATSAGAHARHAEAVCGRGKRIIDLTPAAIGPHVVPPVNLDAHLASPNLNMVTCGGQATIPIVHAIARASARLPYAEIVASIASRSAGPGTRANIDEFTETTAAAIESVGGAGRAKAIIIMNPAEPPLVMRDTVLALAQGAEAAEIEDSVRRMVETVQGYVPGYRLKQAVQFENIGDNNPLVIPGHGRFTGLKVTVFLEVEGAGHYLPPYAGNLDIMTSAALAAAQRIAA